MNDDHGFGPDPKLLAALEPIASPLRSMSQYWNVTVPTSEASSLMKVDLGPAAFPDILILQFCMTTAPPPPPEMRNMLFPPLASIMLASPVKSKLSIVITFPAL